MNPLYFSILQGHTDKIVLGMDVAASEFHVDGKYDLVRGIYLSILLATMRGLSHFHGIL